MIRYASEVHLVVDWRSVDAFAAARKLCMLPLHTSSFCTAVTACLIISTKGVQA
jgi:hypothetical protein